MCVGGREGGREKGGPRRLAAASLSFGIPRSTSGQKNRFSQYFTLVMLLPPTPASAELWHFCSLEAAVAVFDHLDRQSPSPLLPRWPSASNGCPRRGLVEQGLCPGDSHTRRVDGRLSCHRWLLEGRSTE